MRHEGYRSHPYKCSAGALTIGYGHNLNAKGIPTHIAEQLLFNDITDAIEDLVNVVPYYYTLSERRQDALTDMIFNLGKTRFSKFKKMLAALSNQNFEKAADEMVNSSWFSQVGERARTLVKMMREG